MSLPTTRSKCSQRISSRDSPVQGTKADPSSGAGWDCSPDHRLTDEQYRLWLNDPLALYGVENAKLAPGYQTPTNQKKR
ncbi:MAG: hypothetical protein ACYCTV_05305 [Leptospirales bacterium]